MTPLTNLLVESREETEGYFHPCECGESVCTKRLIESNDVLERQDSIIRKAYLLGLERAKECVPEEKELLPYPADRRGGVENQSLSQENNLKAGYNKARTKILEALDSAIGEIDE